MHGSGRFLPSDFDSFRVVETYAKTATERGAEVPAAYEEAISHAHEIEAASSGPEHDPVPCHDDLLEDLRSVALDNEPVRIDGEIRGRVTTGGYGNTVERSIAHAYLPPEHAEPGTGVAVEIFDRWVEGEVASEPLFDPKGERIRA